MTPARYVVTRDVPEDAPNNFAGRAVKAGEVYEYFTGPKWGTVDDENGIALTDTDGSMFEFPLNAVEELS